MSSFGEMEKDLRVETVRVLRQKNLISEDVATLDEKKANWVKVLK